LKSANSPYIFASQDDAYREMMAVALEVIREIRAAGGTVPRVGKMSKDLDRLWAVWKLFAPRGNREAKTGTQF
jgi:hypothetical protein